MTYEKFLKIGMTLEQQSELCDDLGKWGINVIDLLEPYYEVIEELIEEVYGKEGSEWFYWFCYESNFGKKDWSEQDAYIKNDDGTMTKVKSAGEEQSGAVDEQGNPICYDWKSLYEYLETLNNEKQ